jgi:hypothetical protein
MLHKNLELIFALAHVTFHGEGINKILNVPKNCFFKLHNRKSALLQRFVNETFGKNGRKPFANKLFLFRSSAEKEGKQVWRTTCVLMVRSW